MRVYVLEVGEYEQRHVVGVFDTPGRAMAIHPGTWSRHLWHMGNSGRGGGFEEWSCDDWGIVPYELETEGPESPPAGLVRRHDDSRDGKRIEHCDITNEEADAIMEGAR